MANLGKRSEPIVLEAAPVRYPRLTLDRDTIQGLKDLTVDDKVTLTFQAKVTEVIKSDFSDSITFELVKGDLEKKKATPRERQSLSFEALKTAVRKTKITMPAGA